MKYQINWRFTKGDKMKIESFFTMITEKDRRLPLYVTGIGQEENQDHIIRKEGFPYYHLAICDEGAGKLLVGGKEYVIGQGTAFFFYPDFPHEYYPFKEPWTIRWIIFAGFGADALVNAVNFGKYEVFAIHNSEEVNHCYKKLYKVLSVKKNNHMLEASGILYNFLANIGSYIQSNEFNNLTRINEKLNRVIEYIKENYQKELALDEMANLAEVSPSYLCRIFKRVYGMTPFAYVVRYRINVAKQWIVNNPEKSIKSISYEAGFTDCSYFGATFKEYEGCSPNQFRMMYKEKSR